MSSLKEFEYWIGDYDENPISSEDEKWRLFAEMLTSGNLHAIEHLKKLKHEWRLETIKSGEVREDDQPVNTIGDSDVKEVDLSVVHPDTEAPYPKNWDEIATARKDSRQWRCELCAFQLVGSSLIQVHHIDRDKSNNTKLNLQVLCAVCHGQQHWTSPVWPTGVNANDMTTLLRHHTSRHRDTRR